MLIELQRLHASILASLNDLDVLTAQPRPPMDRLTSARLSLTRASRARLMLLERIYDQLITHAPPTQAAGIQALKAEGKSDLAASAQHISTWTLREITARWPDYLRSLEHDAVRDASKGQEGGSHDLSSAVGFERARLGRVSGRLHI